MKLQCILSAAAALLLATGSSTAWGQAASAEPSALEVRLEPHEGKSQFYVGDRIQLDLVFRNTASTHYQFNATDYGDLAASGPAAKTISQPPRPEAPPRRRESWTWSS